VSQLFTVRSTDIYCDNRARNLEVAGGESRVLERLPEAVRVAGELSLFCVACLVRVMARGRST